MLETEFQGKTKPKILTANSNGKNANLPNENIYIDTSCLTNNFKVMIFTDK